MLVVDGSQGEGGGQILRTSLGLSMLTGTPFRIERIRARREKPGLLRQHLTGVRAAAEISSADVQGDELGSTELTFRPRAPRSGSYRFAVGTAGSVGLVFQALLPALLVAGGESEVVIEGGTHAEHAPPGDFLARAFVPLLQRMGAGLDIDVERHGFYPAGGGRMRVATTPSRLEPLELLHRGERVCRRARALVANIPESVAERELAVLRRRLDLRDAETVAEVVPSSGPGNALLVELAFEHATEVISSFGARGRSAESVAEAAASEADRFLKADVPVGEHLCDQVLIPMAMAGRGAFRTMPPSPHARTNAEVIRLFLDVDIRFVEESSRAWRCEVAPAS